MMRALKRWVAAALIACIALTAHASACTSILIQQPESGSVQVQMAFRSTTDAISKMRIRINNISDADVTIEWGSCSLELPDGRGERILHTPVRHDRMEESHAKSGISPGTYIEEGIWPVNMIRFSFSSGQEYTPIGVPRSGGKLGLLIAWSDADGNHEGLWVWDVQRQSVDYTWLYMLVAVLTVGALMVGMVL
ncbi:hypothetical protein IH601_10520 [Candidatus Bipolaricaulota bacterium]|nr:hypothetical protein [Candidatus Bipolaricaulota bacterium]